MAVFKRTRGWRRRGPGIKAGHPEAAVGWSNRLGWDGPRERRVGVGARAARYMTADPAGGGGRRTEGGTTGEIVDSWNRSFDGWLFFVRSVSRRGSWLWLVLISYLLFIGSVLGDET